MVEARVGSQKKDEPSRELKIMEQINTGFWKLDEKFKKFEKVIERMDDINDRLEKNIEKRSEECHKEVDERCKGLNEQITNLEQDRWLCQEFDQHIGNVVTEVNTKFTKQKWQKHQFGQQEQWRQAEENLNKISEV